MRGRAELLMHFLATSRKLLTPHINPEKDKQGHTVTSTDLRTDFGSQHISIYLPGAWSLLSDSKMGGRGWEVTGA